MGRNFGMRPKADVPPPPGSPTALKRGCTCPPQRNADQADPMHGWVRANCPLHGWDPDRLTDGERRQLFGILVRTDDTSFQYFLHDVHEPDLVAALWDPAWEPVWEKCRRNVPSGQLARIRDEWSWAKQDEARSVAAQDRLLRVIRRYLQEGVLS